jgi:hypothetical protein
MLDGFRSARRTSKGAGERELGYLARIGFAARDELHRSGQVCCTDVCAEGEAGIEASSVGSMLISAWLRLLSRFLPGAAKPRGPLRLCCSGSSRLMTLQRSLRGASRSIVLRAAFRFTSCVGPGHIRH